MRVAITTTHIPFIRGGAEALAEGLRDALYSHGHQADIIAMPFRFFPARDVQRAMDQWQTENLESCNGYEIDRVICLKFPAYYGNHPRRVLWLIHQHRSVYELWDERQHRNLEDRELRRRIIETDNRRIAEIPKRFAISENVAARLLRYNGIDAESLYHPPPRANGLYTAPPECFIFCPSRLEELKRQHLLIRAMRHVRSPVVALICGAGGQEPAYRQLIEKIGVTDRVRLLGEIDPAQLAAYYAMSLGVFFCPRDEDYGYVTLEAMLSAKPVITCRDSGGPLEFVRHGETGLIVEPEPESVADAIEHLHKDTARAQQMGQNSHRLYAEMSISWENVVDRLLSE